MINRIFEIWYFMKKDGLRIGGEAVNAWIYNFFAFIGFILTKIAIVLPLVFLFIINKIVSSFFFVIIFAIGKKKVLSIYRSSLRAFLYQEMRAMSDYFWKGRYHTYWYFVPGSFWRSKISYEFSFYNSSTGEERVYRDPRLYMARQNIKDSVNPCMNKSGDVSCIYPIENRTFKHYRALSFKFRVLRILSPGSRLIMRLQRKYDLAIERTSFYRWSDLSRGFILR